MIGEPMATEFPWLVRAGARARISFPILDEDDVAQDIDGWTVDVVIKDRPGGTLRYTFPGEDVDIADAEVTLTIPGPVSAAWPWRAGWLRVKVTDPATGTEDPDVSRVLVGPVIVDPD
jgi:hypothetical protein